VKVLITGGAGFIGSNAARYFSEKGHDVHIYDNFSRGGGRENVRWLKSFNINKFNIIEADICEADKLFNCIAENQYDWILHLAGQVAVTTSVIDPKLDFQSNVIGTFNVLEAIRNHSPHSTLIFASTNKVYGELPDEMFTDIGGRYIYRTYPNGLSEEKSLDFHSPYGCSKGAADQYVIDYGRVYGLKTFVLRQSCIFGTRQFGIEDQGWVAWFAIAAVTGKPITIFGDGKQVRDILHVDDLINCYHKIFVKSSQLSSDYFNVGGGVHNQISLNELIKKLELILKSPITINFGPARVGDQKCFISDNSKLKNIVGWNPKINVDEGLNKLLEWVISRYK
jgi:CDP-paratose 2-epimerase